ncbi:MAG: hypothetical protein ACLFSV_06075 [Alkalispirochaeta sp.]
MTFVEAEPSGVPLFFGFIVEFRGVCPVENITLDDGRDDVVTLAGTIVRRSLELPDHRVPYRRVHIKTISCEFH